MLRPRPAVALLLSLAMLAGCTAAPQAAAPASAPPTAAPPTATRPPTPAPSPTPVPTFPAGSTVGGVDVSGLTLEAAGERLAAELGAYTPALNLRAGPARLRVAAETIHLRVPVEELLEQAAPAIGGASPAEVALQLSYDEEALRARLVGLAEEVSSGAGALTVISSTEVLSRSFAFSPGSRLDVDAAMESVAARLEKARPGASIGLTLPLEQQADPPPVDFDRLRAEVEALAEEWPGVVGFYLEDLATGESVGYNDRSVFAGASTIKVAIMLNFYINVEEPTARQEFWLNEMIRYSDNLSANDLMSAAAGGTGTDLAFRGAEQMSDMLAETLGLQNLYLYVPYESTDYIRQNNVRFRCGPRDPVGPAPHTETGCALRATPYAIAQVYRHIDACAADKPDSLLLEEFATLSPDRCQEMLDWLARNADDTRMVAGVPEGVRVEHKSGWIEFTQADAGIVRSPGGDYILAVYVYRPLTNGRFMWSDEVMAPVVAAFSRLAYTAYNPVVLE